MLTRWFVTVARKPPREWAQPWVSRRALLAGAACRRGALDHSEFQIPRNFRLLLTTRKLSRNFRFRGPPSSRFRSKDGLELVRRQGTARLLPLKKRCRRFDSLVMSNHLSLPHLFIPTLEGFPVCDLSRLAVNSELVGCYNCVQTLVTKVTKVPKLGPKVTKWTFIKPKPMIDIVPRGRSASARWGQYLTSI